MQCFRRNFFVGARGIAVCMLICFCVELFAMLAHAAAPAAPQNTRKTPANNATKPGWGFQVPDRSAQEARWRESIRETLQQTTFSSSAPAGRYLMHNATASGSRLPPAQLEDLDKMRPPENRRPDSKISMQGEFSKEKTGWRPYNDLANATGATPALKEEGRAGAYADFHPGEDVELKLGPEYYLGTSMLRPEQTGHSKDQSGSLGMGMKLKIDF